MSTAAVGLFLFIVPSSFIVFVYQQDIIIICKYLLYSRTRSSNTLGKYINNWTTTPSFLASGKEREVQEVEKLRIETETDGKELDIIVGSESCRRRGTFVQAAVAAVAVATANTVESNTNDDDDSNDNDNDNNDLDHYHRHHLYQQQQQQQQQQRQRQEEIVVVQQHYEQEQLFVGVTPVGVHYGSWEDELIRYNSGII